MDDPQFLAMNDLPWTDGRSRQLPHLERPGGTYFVTFRLADAVIPRPRSEQWTDIDQIAGCGEPPIRLGACLLAERGIGSIVQRAMGHFDGDRYRLWAWCVMPNHVHAVVTPLGGWTLARILHSWKSFTGHQIRKELPDVETVWETESFDHLVRSREHLERFIAYTENNPVAAGLCRQAGDWALSSAHVRKS